MKKYIGTKIVKAEPMIGRALTGSSKKEGYKIIYPDGYISWSPKDTFERAYREITGSEIELINAEASV